MEQNDEIAVGGSACATCSVTPFVAWRENCNSDCMIGPPNAPFRR